MPWDFDDTHEVPTRSLWFRLAAIAQRAEARAEQKRDEFQKSWRTRKDILSHDPLA